SSVARSRSANTSCGFGRRFFRKYEWDGEAALPRCHSGSVCGRRSRGALPHPPAHHALELHRIPRPVMPPLLQLGLCSPPSGAVGGLLWGSCVSGFSALTAVWIAARLAATAAAFAAFFATSLRGGRLALALAFALAEDRLALLAAFVLAFVLAFDRGLAALRL